MNPEPSVANFGFEALPPLESDQILQGLDVCASITGPLLDVFATQSFHNHLADDIEAVYTFPLPPRAYFLGLQFEIAGRTLSGIVRPKERGAREYEQALAEGDAPVLVERQHDGLFTAQLGNLRPGERASIRLHYAQLLEQVGTEARVAIPTVLAPMYGDPGEAGVSPHAVPSNSMLVEHPLRIRVSIEGSTLPHVRSPSHLIEMSQLGDAVEVRSADSARMDRDFVLLIDRPPGIACLAAPDGDGAVGLLSYVAPARASERTTCSLRILLDCSGSMAGDSIDWAVTASRGLVRSLRADDSFSISRFGSHCEHIHRTLVHATPRARSAPWPRRANPATCC